jgi:hypothetical protein
MEISNWKFCKDCKHFRASALRDHPNMPNYNVDECMNVFDGFQGPNLIDGSPRKPKYVTAYSERYDDAADACGPSGNFFQPKETK